MKPLLAIVIPYYKIEYFNQVLQALSRQTNKNFNLYIGDDNSPNNPIQIINEYEHILNIKYYRFKKNLGRKNLVKQWHRCFGLIQNEQWIWFLPDDDVPSPNCVEEFYKALPNVKKENVKVFRIPLKIIDDKSNVISEYTHTDPIIEDNLTFYNRVLRGEAASSLGDNIFHRQSFEESGGFVDFPKAWGSDHATVLRVAKGGNICFLKNASLSFRMSGENISSDRSDGVVKMKSRIQFVKWLKTNENIFPMQPDSKFYQYFYWKGEYYVLNEWKFSFSLLRELYLLKKECVGTHNILPIIKVLLYKIGFTQK